MESPDCLSKQRQVPLSHFPAISTRFPVARLTNEAVIMASAPPSPTFNETFIVDVGGANFALELKIIRIYSFRDVNGTLRFESASSHVAGDARAATFSPSLSIHKELRKVSSAKSQTPGQHPGNHTELIPCQISRRKRSAHVTIKRRDSSFAAATECDAHI